METAYNWANMSHATRLKVGAVLSRDNRPVNTGYNGTIAGQDNRCEDICEVCNGDGVVTLRISDKTSCSRCQGQGKVTSPKVLHAEKNLIAFCARKGIPTEGCTVYQTHSPCLECATLMAQSGIVKVVYDHLYRSTEGIDFLMSVGVEVEQFSCNSTAENTMITPA